MALPIKHLLIADDDLDDIELFESAMLETCPDLKITKAHDGEKLLKILPTIPLPDIIILDLNMPFIGGKECLQKIRSQYQFNEVPIVIFSTSRHVDDINYCLSEGANHYIVKPSSYSDLRTIVGKLCEGELSNIN
ncbi:MAG: response regulator [Ferruginibacter sp.]